MPDHWHGLVELGGSSELSTLVRHLKGFTARAVNIHLGRQGPIWTEGFHDHAVRTDEDLRGIARYIVLNPVRAGLASRVGLYPFWDACWLERAIRDAADKEHRD